MTLPAKASRLPLGATVKHVDHDDFAKRVDHDKEGATHVQPRDVVMERLGRQQPLSLHRRINRHPF